MSWPVPDPQSFLYSTIPPTLWQLLAWAELEEETPLKGLGDSHGIREGKKCRGRSTGLNSAHLSCSASCQLTVTVLGCGSTSLDCKYHLLFIPLPSLMSSRKSYLAEDVPFLVSRRSTEDYEKVGYQQQHQDFYKMASSPSKLWISFFPSWSVLICIAGRKIQQYI